MTRAAATEKFVSVNNLRLRYLEWGGKEKLPLVCLHGHAAQAHIFDEFAEAMSAHYHVYAIDQRGHGESQWATDGYDRLRFVEDLAAVLDALDLRKVVLVGHSMGGWNSLLYTAAHQERVEKIILIDISAEFSEEAKRMTTSRQPTPLTFASFEEAAVWARAGNPFASNERLRQDLLDKMRQREDGKWLWKADPALFNTPLRDGSDPELIASYWHSLATITCPILEVRGKGSPLLSDKILERMRQINPRISFADIEEAGHMVSMDKPQKFIEATAPFLAVPI